MAIVEMNQFTLFVLSEKREALLKELQHFKYVHFLDLKKNEKLKEWELSRVDLNDSLEAIEDDLHKIIFSMNELAAYAQRPNMLQKYKNGPMSFMFTELEKRAKAIDFLSIYKQVRELVSEREHIFHNKMKLKEKSNTLPHGFLSTSQSTFFLPLKRAT